jgi:hypothetical protein
VPHPLTLARRKISLPLDFDTCLSVCTWRLLSLYRLKDHVVEHLDHPDDLFVLLADKYRTFTVPGSMMDCDARHFRVGFGAFPEELKQGLQNFDDALAELMP